MLEQIAKEQSDLVRIVKVDVRDQRQWAQDEMITAVPTLKFYHGGVQRNIMRGGAPKERIVAMVEASKSYSGGEVEGAQKSSIEQIGDDWLPSGVTRE
ncbi:thioredoxin family protein [Persicirhabdus sediminis]|uniref:Thioredoxin family protein n=1 Tax=Persicirhabdus sediminis TaxID=454144 RepID=A0A8J7MB45_9BACT|nr:thioredoxin family protein [Persicirhabdus sediminis]